MNKWILTIALLGFITGLAITTLTDKPEEKKTATTATTSLPPAARDYQLIGHDSDILKGVAFTQPVENPTLKPAEWSQQDINRDVGDNKPVDLTVSLDQQLYGQLAQYVDKFARERDVTIAMNSGTCGISAKQLNEKSADVAGFCCPPGEGDRLPGLRYHTLGISSLALITHPENPLQSVSTRQARDIFSGKIQNWDELGDQTPSAQNIIVVTRQHCKTRPGHWTLLSANSGTFTPIVQDMADIPAMMSQVERFNDTIGYETLFMRDRENSKVNTLAVDGLAPDNLTALARGHYPFYRVYNLTTWQDAAKNPLATELVSYLSNIVEQHAEELYMAPTSQLRANGWGFHGDELIAEPGQPEA